MGTLQRLQVVASVISGVPISASMAAHLLPSAGNRMRTARRFQRMFAAGLVAVMAHVVRVMLLHSNRFMMAANIRFPHIETEVQPSSLRLVTKCKERNAGDNG